jgi:MerR family transcriptional regulator, redox-sensitive transcriptional activator SoxR
MEALTIGEVARRIGMRTSALRYYESVGLLPAPSRVSSGHRRYDPSVLDLLAVLRMAQQAGFTLAEMHLLVAGFSAEVPASERWQLLARRKLQEVEAVIAHAHQTQHLLERLLQCGCLHLEECVQNCAPVSNPSRTENPSPCRVVEDTTLQGEGFSREEI